jgi:hypothetical protein
VAAADDAEVNRRAAAIAAQNEFNRSCNETAAAGRQQFPDFDTRVAELVKTIDQKDPSQVSAYNSFLAAAIETGEGPKLIHALGGDLNEASRIMALSPVKMAIELTKLATGATPMTRAPKPVTPVGSRGTSHEAIDASDPERSDKLDTATWMRRREAELAAKNGAAR